MHYFTKNWACDCFIEKNAPSKSYDFIADKRCLLFSIILKVLSGWDSYQNTGKMYKIIYKNFWKDFVVEQNLTRLKGDFWCFLNRPYEIVVIWDDWQYGSLVSIIIVFYNCTRGRGLGLGRESNLELEIAYFKNGKKGLGCWWDIFTTRIGIWGNWKQKKMDFWESVVYDLEQHFHTRPMSRHYIIFLAQWISFFPIKIEPLLCMCAYLNSIRKGRQKMSF